jgi:hypothetical protein
LSISGNNASQVFELSSKSKPQVTLSGLTISSGLGVVGGGLYNAGALTVNNCTASYNTCTSSGGGIENDGTLTVNRGSQLIGNIAANVSAGDGICNTRTLIVSGSTLSGNTAYQGGDYR